MSAFQKTRTILPLLLVLLVIVNSKEMSEYGYKPCEAWHLQKCGTTWWGVFTHWVVETAVTKDPEWGKTGARHWWDRYRDWPNSAAQWDRHGCCQFYAFYYTLMCPDDPFLESDSV
jgi:hypothetical protein